MATDKALLLKGVVADPVSDAPRLAYAEALVESTRPADRDRAELIRLQIRRESTPGDTREWPSLIARERSLLERHKVAWEKPLRDLFSPSIASPGRWLKTQLFGNGGSWGFRRGFVEHIHTAASRFHQEDVAIFDHAPIRRVVLSHASEWIPSLVRDSRLDRLASLHLVGDMELDEDLGIMASGARSAGLTVFEFRIPRLWQEYEELFEWILAPDREDRWDEGNGLNAWKYAEPSAQARLESIAATPNISVWAGEAAHEGQMLAINEWVYLGNEARQMGAWAVAKAHQDLADDEGFCRRLIFCRLGRGDELRQSPFFHAVVD